jgi:hypothetical protein
MENTKLRLGEKNRKGRTMKREVQVRKYSGLRKGSIPNAIVSVWDILFCAQPLNNKH